MARRGNARIVTGRTMANIEGFQEIKNLFQMLKEKLPQEYRQELERAGDHIKDSAKAKIHNIDGDLSSSLQRKSKFNEKKMVVSVLAGGQRAPHAHLVEFGHRLIKNGNVIGDVPAHPFLRPAFEEYREILAQKLIQVIDRRIQ